MSVTALFERRSILSAFHSKQVLKVLAGIKFSLAHAMENTLSERARVLLTYAPAYFLEVFVAEYLAKRYQNKLWKLAFPLFSHIFNNSLGMLRLFWT